MDFLLEAILEPIAAGIFEEIVGFVLGGFRSVGENGWTESQCRVQTLFGDDVWWNSK
jgi:hypothetical protein